MRGQSSVGMWTAVLILLMLSSSVTNVQADLANTPWPMYQHDLRHTGVSSLVGPDAPPGLKWKFKTGGSVASSVAISGAGTIIYVGSDDGHVYALVDKGQNNVAQLWAFPQNGKVGAVRSSPAIASDGTVYVGSSDGNLYAINPDGTLKWKYTTGDGITSSPAIGATGIIYFGSIDGHVYALKDNGNAGQLFWMFPNGAVEKNCVSSGVRIPCPIISSPAISSRGDVIYIGDDDNKLYALSATNGNKLWDTGVQIKGAIRSSPTIDSGGVVYVGSDDNSVYAIDPAMGVKKWKFDTGGNVRGAPALSSDGKTLYVASKDSNLYSINTADGTQKWSFDLGGKSTSSPAIDKNGIVYVGSFASIFAVRDGGKDNPIKVWEFDLGGSTSLASTVIGPSGTLYMGSSDKNLYAIWTKGSFGVPEFGAGTILAVGLGAAGLVALRRRFDGHAPSQERNLPS